jgi:hypothetical protein
MLYDLVIMLPGNSYITCFEEVDVPKMEDIISVSVNANPPQLLVLKDGNRTAHIKPTAILGWYFKPHEKAMQEKMYEVVKKAIEPPEDDWKNSND